MNKKLVSVLMAAVMAASLTACGGAGASVDQNADSVSESSADVQEADNVSGKVSQEESNEGSNEESNGEASGDNFRIGIVTGSYAQSEDDRRGAEAFRDKYGADRVTLAIYPDNFTEELEITIQTIVNLSEDPDMKAIIVNQAVDGTAEAFRRIKETRPDILCIAGEAYEDFADIEPVADLVVSSDFVARGYLMIRSAHELGCDTFVHISFPRHLSYETVSRQVAIMKAACEEFGMTFAMEEAPDPTTDVGVPGAQSFILEHVPEWVEKYGQKSAYFCTNDAHTEPLIKKLLECGGYFIEADLPSPLMGYPGALDLDLTEEAGDFEKILEKVEGAVVEKGGAERFGTWAYSYGYTVSAGLAEHARNVIIGESKLTDINDLSKAYGVFSPGAEWNGSNYTDAATGVRSDNTFLIYQDTYIFGDPGHYMGTTKVKVPDNYFTINPEEND
ncbi:MAG: DUF3798 domain-containing protein [Lachnospiraceae bacterium]|nr:DUF3798 domain-containing protein [Lachnospiraceae bacterium]